MGGDHDRRSVQVSNEPVRHNERNDNSEGTDMALNSNSQPLAVIVQQGKVLDFIDGQTQREETPEEYVRQEIAKSLVREYGYPKKDIAVEFTFRLGSRKPRADLVIFSADAEHSQETGYIIVECKAHTWTESGNVPVAKMTTWNEAMFFFYAAPSEYRKILFVLRDISSKRKETLVEYYVRTNPHLIPDKVEVWEYDTTLQTARQVAIPGR